jgi:hypothetical protein
MEGLALGILVTVRFRPRTAKQAPKDREAKEKKRCFGDADTEPGSSPGNVSIAGQSRKRQMGLCIAYDENSTA